MRHATYFLWPLSSLLVLACGAGGAAVPEPLDSPAVPLTQAVSQGCFFQVSSRTPRGPMPPMSQVVVTRRDLGGCVAGNASVVVGTTYDVSSLSVLAGPGGVAVAYSFKATPGGSAAVSLQVLHLHPRTLERERGTTLSAWRPSSAGYVYDGTLSLGDEGTTLEVRGAKNGIISGEAGGGGLYTARYPDFFTGTAPPSVTAREE